MSVRRGATLLALVALATATAGSLGACGVGYILQQGVGQLEMLGRREPIARVLREPDLPAETRDRLVLVWHARAFAINALGLHASESYRDVVRLDRDAASYVVAAAPQDSLEPYRWCFPIAGCLPYIGYFHRADAEREKVRMSALGYDVQLRGVSAYSLGGWLPDPVYSPLLSESRGWVANTVIHELTHGTVFIAGRADFNEAFATFVGDHGELTFLESRYGRCSRTARDARAEENDERVYNAFLTDVRAQLVAIYSAPISRDEKIQRRMATFAAARERVRNLPFQTPDLGERLSHRSLNNAVLATHSTYYGAETLFDGAYRRLGSDLRRLIRFVHDEVAPARDPSAYLARWNETHPVASADCVGAHCTTDSELCERGR